MYPCIHIFIYPYIHISIYPYIHISRYHKSIYPYIHISIYPYLHTQEHPGAPRRHPRAPRRHPGAPRRHPRGTQEHPGALRRHPGDTQGTPKGHPEAPRAPEVILSENLPKPLSFTVKMAAGTYFVREWRRRHAPFPQPAHKNESPHRERNIKPIKAPFIQHRKDPYSSRLFGE